MNEKQGVYWHQGMFLQPQHFQQADHHQQYQLGLMRKAGHKFDIMSTSFFLSRRSIKPSPQSGMPVWQDNLFIGLTKSATDATNFFQIPTGRVVEVGTQVTV